MSITLKQHQEEGIKMMEKMEKIGKGGLVCDEMGLGKTIMTIYFLIKNKIEGKKDLIIVPLSLIEHWKREILRVKPDARICIFHGKDRLLKKKDEFVISTYSFLGRDIFKGRRWGRVILDEAHTIRNGIINKHIKSAKGAFNLVYYSDFRWCLTGTPFNNSQKDIVSLCKFIGTEPYNNPDWWKKSWGGKDETEVAEWTKSFMIKRTKAEILKTPDPIYTEIEIDSTSEERDVIESYRKKAYSKYLEYMRAEGLRKRELRGEILALITRLRICSDSFFCATKKVKSKDVMGSCAKVSSLIDLMKDRLKSDPNRCIVVFSLFVQFLDLIESIIPDYLGKGVQILKFTGKHSAEERTETLKKFNESKKDRILLISFHCGSVGLDLKTSSNVIMTDNWYNPFAEKQAEERVNRLGQKNPVYVFRLTMKSSVETWIDRIKKKKLNLASELGFISSKSTFSFEDLGDLFKDLVAWKIPEADKEFWERQEARSKARKAVKREKVKSEIKSKVREEDSLRERFAHQYLPATLPRLEHCPD